MSGSRCSLKNKQQPGPCKHCRESNNECTFVLIPANAVVDIPTSKTKQTGRKKEVSKKPAKRRHQASTPDQNGIDNNFSSPNEQLTYNLGKEYSDRRLGRKGRQTLLPYGDADPSGGRRTKKKEQLLEKGKRISRSKSTNTGDDTAQPMLIRTTAGIQHTFTKTSFCHPIQFNYIPDPLGNFPCSWCSFPFFGFFGHGERTVEIVPWASVNGNGNEEILGGHAAEHPNTKMCVSCTFARIRILSCARHIIRQIKHLDEDTFDEAALGESLIAYDACDQAGGKLALDTKWCAVCRTPAFYECCTPQAFDASGELVPDGQVLHGCGLVLCGECAQFYGKVEKGLRGAVGVDRTSQNWGGGSHAEVSGAEVLSRMVGETKCSLLYDEMGIRADATFLTLSGELMVRMRLGMGQHRGAGAGAGGNGERSEVLELSDSDDEIGDDILGEVLRRNKGRINGGIRGPLLSKEIGKGQGGGHGSGRSGSGNRQGKGPRVLER
jgi:hypothetical protein